MPDGSQTKMKIVRIGICILAIIYILLVVGDQRHRTAVVHSRFVAVFVVIIAYSESYLFYKIL